MKHLSAWFSIALLLGLSVSCAGAGGTETDNPDAPLKDFSASACKNKDPAPGAQALTLASSTDGLQCVSWERNATGNLDIKLLNFPEPCGEKYLGNAAVAGDGTLALSVYKDTCDVYKCGLCVFDFDFELRGISDKAALELKVGAGTCASEPVTFSDSLSLPIDQESSGIACRELSRSALEWYARGASRCGQPNMPCGICDSATDTTTCQAGSTCGEVATGDSRCLADCKTDADCDVPATHCQNGGCQANADF
jgi:hypothetical protein